MSFESGRISCRIFFMPRSLPQDAVESFARDAAPAISGSSSTEYRGWVSGRHLLDRNITEDTAHYGGYLRLALLNAQRKVPAALLQAECKMEELAQMAAEDATSLSGKKRRAIRLSVQERLLPNMPPQLRGIPMVIDEKNEALYTGAVTVPQSDLFAVHFSHTLGFNVTPWLPSTLALARKSMDVRDWRATSFSPDVPDDRAGLHPGREFLTWLWFVGEVRGGTFELPDVGSVSCQLEGPLAFAGEEESAPEIVLRKGEPLGSAEAEASLRAGRKLKRACLTLARFDETWSTTLDADEFTFRSLRLPDTESFQPEARFQERIELLNNFRGMFMEIYDAFLEERGDAARWKATQGEIHEWVKDRTNTP